jgi:hypothetical protein
VAKERCRRNVFLNRREVKEQGGRGKVQDKGSSARCKRDKVEGRGYDARVKWDRKDARGMYSLTGER